MKIYGIFGFPLKHTLSPAMHEAAFANLGIEAGYLPFELDRAGFRRVARQLAKSLLAGFNLTVPYKEAILPYLDKVAKEAAMIGAVNTVCRKGRKFWGYNTDWEGFALALREARFRARGKSVLLLGAGGAARACVYALGQGGARRIVLMNRHQANARKMSRHFQGLFRGIRFEVFPMRKFFLTQALRDSDLVVNATSVGLKREDRLGLTSGMLRRRRPFVFDLIYNPPETGLLKAARKAGCRTLNGLSMLVYQGARAFEIWTGRKAPLNLMRRSLKRTLG